VAETVDEVIRRLEEVVGSAALKWERPRPNRVYFTVAKQNARETGRRLVEDLRARFATATGTDIGEELEVIYHFECDAVGLVINMRVRTPKGDPVLPSLTPVVPPADWIEREINDLLGVVFEGHPDPRRLILADDWPQGVYPLRREQKNDA
jgi:Ni,Fe-hydrogenase III component G